MSSRREFITLLGGAAAGWPLSARAQQAGKLPIDYAFDHEPMDRRFCRAAARTWLDRGSNHQDRVWWAEGRGERYADIAAEFVRLKVDVIVTTGPAAPQAKKATSIIPIVLALSGDPVGAGLVASLARPGGNITGLSMLSADLAGKRLELFSAMTWRLLRRSRPVFRVE